MTTELWPIDRIDVPYRAENWDSKKLGLLDFSTIFLDMVFPKNWDLGFSLGQGIPKKLGLESNIDQNNIWSVHEPDFWSR